MSNSNNPQVFQNRSTIAKVVDGVLLKHRMESNNDYDRLLQFAKWGHRELQLHVHSFPKQIKFDMNEAKNFLLPNDFVQENLVALCIAGSYVAIYADHNMCVKAEDCGGVPDVVRKDPYVESSYAELGLGFGTLPYYENGQFMGGQYGYAANSDAIQGYRITKRGNGMKMITFDSSVPTTSVYMEYMSTGESPDGRTIIDVEQEAPLRAYIEYEMADSDPQSTESFVDRKKRAWRTAVKNYRHLVSMFTEDDYLNVLRGHTHQLPKR